MVNSEFSSVREAGTQVPPVCVMGILVKRKAKKNVGGVSSLNNCLFYL